MKTENAKWFSFFFVMTKRNEHKFVIRSDGSI
jgi:hypothetical protein